MSSSQPPLSAANGSHPRDESKARASQGALLLIGSGIVADSLARALSSHNADVQRTVATRAASSVEALLPDLVVLAGDAAQGRGTMVLAQLARAGAQTPTPIVVICAPELGGLATTPAPRHIGYLSPDGGMGETARRLCALADVLAAGGLAKSTMEQLVESARTKAAPAGTQAKPTAAKRPTATFQAGPAPRVDAAAAPKPATPETASRGAFGPAAPVAQPLSKPQSTQQQPLQLTKTAPFGSLIAQPAAASAAASAPEPRSQKVTTLAMPAMQTATKPLPLGAAMAAKPLQPAPVVEPPKEAPATAEKSGEVALALDDRSTNPPRLSAAEISVSFSEPPARAELEVSFSEAPAGLNDAQTVRPTQPSEHDALVLDPTPMPPPPGIAADDDSTTIERRLFDPFGTATPSAAAASSGAKPPRLPRDPLATPPEPAAVLAPDAGPEPAKLEEIVARSPFAATLQGAAEPPSSPRVALPAQAPAAGGDVAQRARDPLASASMPAAVSGAQRAAPAEAAAARRARDPLATPPEPQPVSLNPAQRMRDPLAPVAFVANSGGPNPAKPARDPLAPAAFVANSAAASPAKPARDPLGAPPELPAARRGRDVLASPQPSAAAQLDAPAPARGKNLRRALVAGGLAAAVGCGALLFQLRFGEAHDALGSRAAAGALQYVPNAQPPAADQGGLEQAANPAPVVSPAAPDSPAAASQTTQLAPSERPMAGARSGGSTREAASTKPDATSPQQLVDSGTALLRQGRLGLAEGMFLKALQAAPDNPNAMAELVRVHLARRDGVEALRWANRLVGVQPSSGANQLLLGDALKLRGDADGARNAWSRAARAGNATAKERLAADEE